MTDQYDVGQATMAMMLAATDLGIGTGHSSVGDQDKARAILGVPDDYQLATLLGVGYPADRALKPIRKPGGLSTTLSTRTLVSDGVITQFSAMVRLICPCCRGLS